MRTARNCAEEALQGLEDDATLDQVELPLYTTCSRLISTPGDIREAAVSSALNGIGDLGGSRIVKALCLFFTERRDEPTLLVIDSLDEASDVKTARDRLRQAGSLMPPWRVVLTSRRSSWNNQLSVEDANPAHRVGELKPLRYPDDVEPVMQQWFAKQPEHCQALAAQIAQRPSLQQAATVPLILAFYCILAGGRILVGDRPLPRYRHTLYEQVINRMLSGVWRPGSGPLRDADACRETLRTWAWRAAKNRPLSGVGRWEDDISTRDTQLSLNGQIAVDHIAAPSGGAGFDTDETSRRFVHRSIREHLVAEYVANLPAEQAVAELLPHLWYDPDWEYTAPAAIAMNEEHDKLLRDLLCRAARSDEIPGDLSVIDAGGEVCKLLARVASESQEGDWSPEVAEIIGQARVELAESGAVYDLGAAVQWPASNRQVRHALLRRLSDNINGREAVWLTVTLTQLEPTPDDKRQAIDALLSQITGANDDSDVDELTSALIQLEPTPDDKRQAIDALLSQITGANDDSDVIELTSALIQLKPTPDDKRQAIDALLAMLAEEDRWVGPIVALAWLDPTPDEKRQAIDALLGLLADPSNYPHNSFWKIGPYELAQLAQTTEDKRQAREAVLRWLTRDLNGSAASSLVGVLSQLDPTPADVRQVLDAVFALLERRITRETVDPLAATVLGLVRIGHSERQALDALLDRLTQQAVGIVPTGLVALVAQLDPAPDDKRKALDALLDRLTNHTTTAATAADLAAAVLQLDPEPDDKRMALDALLARLANRAAGAMDAADAAFWLFFDRARGSLGAELAALVLQFDPTPSDKRRALDAVLRLLTGQATGTEAVDLAATVGQLDPTPDDKRLARDALLAQLVSDTEGWNADNLASALAQLDPTPHDKRQACDALLAQIRAEDTEAVAAGLRLLDATPNEMRQAREALLGQLSGRHYGTVTKLVRVVLQLTSTSQDKREVRHALLNLLTRETNGPVAKQLVRGVAQLDPTVGDLIMWRAWAAPPSSDLLAEARLNSALDEWLAVLDSLRPLSS